MPIQINNSTIIDDSRNLVNSGIVTVGSGNSSVVLQTGATFVVGTGVTFNKTDNTISIAGTITAAGLSIPLSLS